MSGAALFSHLFSLNRTCLTSCYDQFINDSAALKMQQTRFIPDLVDFGGPLQKIKALEEASNIKKPGPSR